MALVANGTCLFLLTRHRGDDLNMRSTWLCSRNDIIANVGVVAAAAVVFLVGSPWPDLVVGLVITVVFLRSSVYVVQQAVTKLRSIENQEGLIENRQPIVLLPNNCSVNVCPDGSCLCQII